MFVLQYLFTVFVFVYSIQYLIRFDILKLQDAHIRSLLYMFVPYKSFGQLRKISYFPKPLIKRFDILKHNSLIKI